MPSPGRTRRHADRFDRQEQGLTAFLTAWADDVPVGTAQILWQGCAAPEVQARFPGCPELNGLGIWPPELRSRGIGTALIRAVEERVRAAGHTLIGLGVDDDNHRAAALYLRIGYRETGCRYLEPVRVPRRRRRPARGRGPGPLPGQGAGRAGFRADVIRPEP
ncbi:acetyltransferase (GNAT) family protein [Streptomyces sp. HB202]|nr:acetyltransferase (GNAT) family protein [Streptomyces sp. HB202]